MAKRNIKSKDLTAYIDITETNLSLLKQEKIKNIRFETLEKIYEFLNCEPGDILRIDRRGSSEQTD